MVEEFGDYLEELAKDYLTIVEGHDLVDIEVRHSPQRSTGHAAAAEITSSSVVDVAGVKGKTMMFVACREWPRGPEVWEKDVEQLKSARRAKDFRNFKVRYSVAYAHYPKEIAGDHIRQFFKDSGVRVLFLEEMVEELLMATDG